MLLYRKTINLSKEKIPIHTVKLSHKESIYCYHAEGIDYKEHETWSLILKEYDDIISEYVRHHKNKKIYDATFIGVLLLWFCDRQTWRQIAINRLLIAILDQCNISYEQSLEMGYTYKFAPESLQEKYKSVKKVYFVIEEVE